MSRFLLGLIFGIVLVPLAALTYLTYGKVPVAVGDPPFPDERQIVHIPLNARIEAEVVGTHMEPVPENLIAGAHIYVERCAFCHGLHNRPAAIGNHMYPDAPPLLEPRPGNPDIVGVSDDTVGETYWKVYNGIRLTGMPSFKTQLNDNELWQVTIFLANANKPMPPTVIQTLNRAPSPLEDNPRLIQSSTELPSKQ
jgi:mono/diheme cytochrome c family protein